MARENLDPWIEEEPDLIAPTSRPLPAIPTPVPDMPVQANPDDTIEEQLTWVQEQEEVEASGVRRLSTDEEPVDNGGGGSSRNAPYGPDGASRSFTPKARKREDTPTVLREKKNRFESLLRMLERRDSSYTMEATGGNQFKMTDISVGD